MKEEENKKIELKGNVIDRPCRYYDRRLSGQLKSSLKETRSEKSKS
jgi:hypothetical protein